MPKKKPTTKKVKVVDSDDDSMDEIIKITSPKKTSKSPKKRTVEEM